MPITKVIIENFKGIRDRVEIPIRPITLLFGANSAGKSTILQALLYFRELLERDNADADRLLASGAAIDLGGFEQFVHAHELERKIRIGLEMQLDADGLPSFDDSEPTDDPLADISTIQVDLLVEWCPGERRPFITHYQVGIDGKPFGAIRADPGFEAELTTLNYDHPLLRSPEDDDEEESGDPGGLSQVFRDVFLYSGIDLDSLLSGSEPSNAPEKQSLKVGLRVVPDFGKMLPDHWRIPPSRPGETAEFKNVLTILSRVFCGAGSLVLKELQKIRYLGPTRVFPSRGYRSQRSPGNSRWADGSAAWDLIYSDNGGGDWFDPNSLSKLGLGYRFEVKNILEVPVESQLGSLLVTGTELAERLMDLDADLITREVNQLVQRSQLKLVCEDSGIEVDPSDVGSGVSQVVPVVVGAMAPGYSILSVEQPELHIHPAVQCELADALAEEVLDSSDRCLLLETHSEHLMLRWLRRIRERHEEELPPGAPSITADQLSVLYVESNNEGQRITFLPVTEDGDFAKKWPQGFFEERAEELF